MKKNINTAQGNSNRFALSAFLILVMQVISINGNSQCPFPCMTNTLNINTGRVHDSGNGAGANAWHNTPDEYWYLSDGPGPYTYNTCAIAWQWAPFWGGGISFGPNSSQVSVVPWNTPATDNGNLSCNLNAGSSYYTFEREFKVCFPSGVTSATGVLDIHYAADDKVENIVILWPGGSHTVSGSSTPGCGSNDNTISMYAFPIPVEGIYKIRVNVINTTLLGNPTIMKMQLEGTVAELNGNNIFVDNNHFGRHANNCSSTVLPYFAVPDLTLANCIYPPTTNVQINIGNFVPAVNNYEVRLLNGTLIAANPGASFIGQVGETYVVSAIDNFGCVGRDTIEVAYAPVLSLNPSPLCIPLNGSAITMPIVQYGAQIFTFTSSSPLLVPMQIPVLGTVLLATMPGNYTVTVTDANGCTGTTTLSVGNNFSVDLTGVNGIPACLTLGTSIDLEAITTPPITNLEYSFNGGPYTIDNQMHNVNALGTYTVVAKDPYGCNAMSTVTVHENPTVTITSSGLPCERQFTAAPANLNYTWGLPGYNPLLTNNELAWPQNVYPDVPGQNPANMYVVMGVDAFGCTGTATINWAQDEFCCNLNNWGNNNSPAKFSSQTLPPYNNGTATDMITTFGVGNVIDGFNANVILLDGTIIIDQDLTLQNFYAIRLTAGTQIIINPGVTLTIDHSSLMANCNELWNGIFVGPGSHLITTNGAILEDMHLGVVSVNGGTLDCTNTTFRGNYYSMQIIGAPVGFNAANGCIVNNNIFIDGGGYLLYPYATQQYTESAIRIINCREVQIGALNGGGNFFSTMYNGINIIPGAQTQNENYFLFNNRFTEIDESANAFYSDVYFKVNNWAKVGVQGHRGSAIYCNPGYKFGMSNNHTAHIECDDDTWHYKWCDRAVLLHATSAEIIGNRSTECLMSYLFNRSDNQEITMDHNSCWGVYPSSGFNDNAVLGTRIVGNPLKCTLTWNQHQMSDFVTAQFAASKFYPVGIDIENGSKFNTSIYNLNNNHTDIYCDAGVGMLLRNTNATTDLALNVVNIHSLGAYNITDYVAAGIYVEDADGSHFRGNWVQGNFDLLANINQMDGMRMMKSEHCQLQCNLFHTIRRGLKVISNCATGVTDVEGNMFNTMGYGMEFNDLGTPASLGNIGSFTVDNRNWFYNSALFPPNTYGIYRKVTWPFFLDRIYTTSPTSPPSYTWSDLPLGAEKYVIQLNPGATQFQLSNCDNIAPAALAMMMGESSIDSTEAIEIAEDSSANGQYSQPVSWMEQRRLFNALSGADSILLSNQLLATFYTNQLLTNSDELKQVDDMLVSLSDSVLRTDSVAYAQRLLDLETMNNSIGGNNSLELNEKLMNTFYIDMLRGQYDSLEVDSADLVLIENLANSCPFINGYGVYKARILNTMLGNYTNVNDITLCNGAGMYKNGYAGDDEPIIDPNLLTIVKDGNIKIYPNPFNNQITIDYSLDQNEKGVVNIFDLLGRLIQNIDLNPATNRVTIKVNNIANGVYFYKFIINERVVESGKLIKD